MALTAFFVVYVAILFWAIPWLPSGLSKADYTHESTSVLVLLSLASATAFCAVYLRDQKRRIEQTLLTWTTLHDGLSDLRQREYFFDRIIIECKRAKARRAEFTVAVLKLGGEKNPPDTKRLRRALEALEPMIDEFDCLASIGQHEIGVLAPAVTGEGASDFRSRLHDLVASSLASSKAEVQTGHAVFGPDGTDPGELVGLARSRMLAAAHADGLAAKQPSDHSTAVA